MKTILIPILAGAVLTLTVTGPSGPWLTSLVALVGVILWQALAAQTEEAAS